MPIPRLEINLQKIEENTQFLVNKLAMNDISVTGVMKVMRGNPLVAQSLINGGVSALGDSHIESIELMNSDIKDSVELRLIRTPMLSQVRRVILSKALSFNTEMKVIKALSRVAEELNIIHEIILMVELGDIREGILPDDIINIVRQILTLPNIVLQGIGTNLACLNGVIPDAIKMCELSVLAEKIELFFAIKLKIISGGNSSNLGWILTNKKPHRINDLRLGESIFLGIDPVHNRIITGLHTKAIQLVCEVIESKIKSATPYGKIGTASFQKPAHLENKKNRYQSILAVGEQDINPSGLYACLGYEIIGATSDHLMIDSGHKLLKIGEEVVFNINYSTLLRSMGSSLVYKVYT